MFMQIHFLILFLEKYIRGSLMAIALKKGQTSGRNLAEKRIACEEPFGEPEPKQMKDSIVDEKIPEKSD